LYIRPHALSEAREVEGRAMFRTDQCVRDDAMTMLVQNLFAQLPAPGAGEESKDLYSSPDLRIERIVSVGHASPPGFWYDQDWPEWVMVVAGEAHLLFAGESAPRLLARGDFVHIPAHVRHRVEGTAPGEPTVWLAIHHRRV
jgi:cupin 2 domain-containing protein